MPHLRLAAAAILGSLLLGCEEDVITQPRPDSGVPPRDGGSAEPLPLEAGMTFTYLGQCTYRGQGAGMERNSQYRLIVTIQSVDDRGAAGPSSLQFTATGENLLGRDWDATADFDLWVARLGPAQASDVVGPGAVTVDLSEVPTIPSPPSPPPKRLPVASSFFLDLRQSAGLQAAFAEAYAGRSPQVVDPERDINGQWVFSTAGRDETIVYYPPPAKTRSVRLAYDPRGFLVRLSETLGDTSTPPAATCFLNLDSGP